MFKTNKIFSLFISLLFLFSFTLTAAADAPQTALLLDDYNRDILGGDVANGGAYGDVNSRGNTIYWINYNPVSTFPEIIDGVLKVTFEVTEDADGWFGEGASIKSEDGYKFLVMRMRGETGGEENVLSLNPDARGAINFSDLVDPEGNPIKITTEWQDIIIDLEQNGFRETVYAKGMEAVHMNTTGSAVIYIDEIYLSQTADIANEPPWEGMTAAPDAETVPIEEISIPEGTATDAPVTLAPYAEIVTAGDAVNENDISDGEISNFPLFIGVIIGGVILIALIVYLFFAKKPKK